MRFFIIHYVKIVQNVPRGLQALYCLQRKQLFKNTRQEMGTLEKLVARERNWGLNLA